MRRRLGIAIGLVLVALFVIVPFAIYRLTTPHITIVNESGQTLNHVQLTVGSATNTLGTLSPGERKSFRIKPPRDRSIALSYEDAGGRTFRLNVPLADDYRIKAGGNVETR